MRSSHRSENFVAADALAVAPHLLGRAVSRPGRRVAVLPLGLLLVTVLAKGGAILLGPVATA